MMVVVMMVPMMMMVMPPPSPVMMVVMMVVVLRQFDLAFRLCVARLSAPHVVGFKKRDRVGDGLQQVIIGCDLHHVCQVWDRHRRGMSCIQRSQSRNSTN